MNEPRPLEYASTDDLVAELYARGDVVFVGLSSTLDGNDYNKAVWFKDPMACIGLMEYARALLLREVMRGTDAEDGPAEAE